MYLDEIFANTTNLSIIMSIEVLRADENSASQTLLSHYITYTGYTESSIEIKIDFENPLSVSIGDSKDLFRVNFIKPELFVSKESGKALN